MQTSKFGYWGAVLIYMSLGAASATHAGEPAELSETFKVNSRSYPAMETLKRVTSSLQKLERNLILERTRGEKEIAVYQKAVSAVVLVIAGKDSIGSGALFPPKAEF